MEDDNEVVVDLEADAEGEELVVLEEGHLMPIEDNDLRDAAREVERVMEREELRRCHLMMDDQAF